MSPPWRRGGADGARELEALRWVRARIDREQVQAARFLALFLPRALPGRSSGAVEPEPPGASVRPIRPRS